MDNRPDRIDGHQITFNKIWIKALAHINLTAPYPDILLIKPKLLTTEMRKHMNEVTVKPDEELQPSSDVELSEVTTADYVFK